MATKVYLDTWLLRALVSDQRHERGEARSEIMKLKSPTYEVAIPQIALGEAFATIIRDYEDPLVAINKLTKLHEDLNSIITNRQCFPVTNSTSMQYAQELKIADPNLRETDLLIVAQALHDPESQRLLTQDLPLINSQVIKDKEKELRDCGSRTKWLKIVDGL